MDVEVLKPIDIFLKQEVFMGFEGKNGVTPGLIIGSEKGNNITKTYFCPITFSSNETDFTIKFHS